MPGARVSALPDKSTRTASPTPVPAPSSQTWNTLPDRSGRQSNSTVRGITTDVYFPGTGNRKRLGLIDNDSGRGNFPSWIYGDPSPPLQGSTGGEEFLLLL